MTRFILLIVLLLTGGEYAVAKPIVILALGDSLTAGYGLPPEQAFPVKLEQALQAQGHDVRVINAGVSGDTASDGLARLDWALGDAPDAVIVELGANDALRGLPVPQARTALDGILARLSERKLPVLLAGMRAPPNLGPDYTTAFNAMYGELAQQYNTVLYPFFLEAVAARPALNQNDGMHPNVAGVDVIVKMILPDVNMLLSRVKNQSD